MTTPIDLGLVELRCKLRGWTYRDNRADLDSGFWLEVTAPTGSTSFQYGVEDDGRRVAGTWTPPPGHWRPRDHVKEELVRPRLTLADIIADPGQGWRVERVNAGLVRFHFDAALISVEWRKGRIHETWLRTWALNMDQRLAAHRAVTDLLIRLAEVEPRA